MKCTNAAVASPTALTSSLSPESWIGDGTVVLVHFHDGFVVSLLLLRGSSFVLLLFATSYLSWLKLHHLWRDERLVFLVRLSSELALPVFI